MIILLLDSYSIILILRNLIWAHLTLLWHIILIDGVLQGFEINGDASWRLICHLTPKNGIQVVRVVGSAIKETDVSHELLLEWRSFFRLAHCFFDKSCI